MADTSAHAPVPLSEDESLRLLQDASLGRLAWADASSVVHVIPVNFALDGRDVVVRLTPETAAHLLAAAETVTFEADDVEQATHAGWSVLVHGPAEEVTDEEEVRRVGTLVHPWAGGDRNTIVRVRSTVVTGRRIAVHPGGVFVVHLGAGG